MRKTKQEIREEKKKRDERDEDDGTEHGESERGNGCSSFLTRVEKTGCLR